MDKRILRFKEEYLTRWNKIMKTNRNQIEQNLTRNVSNSLILNNSVKTLYFSFELFEQLITVRKIKYYEGFVEMHFLLFERIVWMLKKILQWVTLIIYGL